ncbi:MAG: hypothetical protein FJ202_12335 [Gemmatimonadetes bacterium]|nr:hypothetical protein [Gemmatimonadota bacterium]
MSAATQARAARRHKAPADFAAAQRLFEEKSWTDGLPVVPPTEALVREMLAHTPLAPHTALGRMEPAKSTVTIEKVAANAVMAGCSPEYFPVVVAAIKALLQPQFHVGSTACTTGGAAPVLIVSGPLAEKLGINAGTACFGGNVKANATIGRAVRLVMRNLGGAKPDGMEKSTLAWPGKISMCFSENEARTPWEPFRVDRGHGHDVTTVSAVATRGIYAVTEGTQETGVGVLETLAGAMRMIGAPVYYQRNVPVVVCLGPEHASEIARSGFSKRGVREYLFEHCRLPVRALRGRGYYAPGCWGPEVERNDDALVPIVSTPDHLWIVVAGGDGRHSAWMPAWNVCEGATAAVEVTAA